VAGDMLVTTLLMAVVARGHWGVSWPLIAAVAAPLLLLDLLFVSGNLHKIPAGGWFPLLVGAAALTVMLIWRRGRAVLLARASHPGEVVYGASVTLVTTSSLAELARRTGGDLDGAQFRATFTVDTGEAPAHVEDTWVGRRLHLGAAEVEVRGVVPRCAVIDLDPDTGERRSPALKTLGGYRHLHGEVAFGVDAVVTQPGQVRAGDRVDIVGRS